MIVFLRVLLILVALLLGCAKEGYCYESFLKGVGMENVRAVCCNDTLYASFEEHEYRGTFRGVGAAIQALHKQYPSLSQFEIVIKEYNIDKVAVHAGTDGMCWRVGVDYDMRQINRRLDVSGNKKGGHVMTGVSYGKTNITFYPILSLDNHLTFKLFSYSVMVAPALETSLWTGNRLIVQPIIPLYNNYESSKVYMEDWNDKYLQLGAVNIQQDFVNNGRLWARVALGTFRYNYIGANIDFGVRLNRRMDIGVDCGVVGIHDWNDFKFHVGNINNYNALLKMSYYEPKSSTELKLSMGRFVFGDVGARFECRCHFGEYVVGAYGIVSGGEHNAGFNFSVPVAGKWMGRRRLFNPRLPESFDWEYKVVSAFAWADKKLGREYDVNGGRDMSAHYWQAEYIQTYLQLFLEGRVD